MNHKCKYNTKTPFSSEVYHPSRNRQVVFWGRAEWKLTSLSLQSMANLLNFRQDSFVKVGMWDLKDSKFRNFPSRSSMIIILSGTIFTHLIYIYPWSTPPKLEGHDPIAKYREWKVKNMFCRAYYVTSGIIYVDQVGDLWYLKPFLSAFIYR